MSLRSFLFAGMSWLGDLQMGVLAEWFGARIALLVSATLCLTAAILVSWRAPQLRSGD
jgi:hypothetical protein